MHERRRKQRSTMAVAAERKRLVNSKNPHDPFIYLLSEGTWAARW
jgi:hypothetical protein